MNKPEVNIFSPIKLGRYELPNRIFMAPLTRNRAGAGNVPQPLNATYYEQRATAGLIITEASQVSPQGVGYPGTPGIHSKAQVDGWKLVTNAVHKKGGKIFLQLWHVGRISHPSLQENGAIPVSASAIAPKGQAFTMQGMVPFVTPRALTLQEIPQVVNQYAHGAKCALEAGFDGVEIHGANGYLIDQFLRDGSNKRTDEYGGSVEKRARFLLEVVDAVTKVWGSDRVGIRMSPYGAFNDMSDSDPKATFGYVLEKLMPKKLAYVHLLEPMETDPEFNAPKVPFSYYRSKYPSTLIVNSNYTKEKANQVLSEGLADAVAFGKLFIANPDLVARFKQNAPLNTPDQATFYGGDSRGYTDYPIL